MYGCSDFDSMTFKPSAGQLKILERVSGLVASAGPPSCTSAEAFHELCGARAGPGYDSVDAPRARYQPGLVSLPDEGGLTDGSSCLRGAARDFWYRWQELLLATEPAPSDIVPDKPYSDAALIHNKWEYARFCSSLFNANMLELGDFEEPTVGVFFVRKKNITLRMIFDTRCVNSLFVKPNHTHLPSPAAWVAVRTRADAPLYLAQMDVNNAFFRVRTPPGLSRFFKLPPVDVESLRAVNPLAARGLAGRKCTPRLCVLAMGWS